MYLEWRSCVVRPETYTTQFQAPRQRHLFWLLLLKGIEPVTGRALVSQSVAIITCKPKKKPKRFR